MGQLGCQSLLPPNLSSLYRRTSSIAFGAGSLAPCLGRPARTGRRGGRRRAAPESASSLFFRVHKRFMAIVQALSPHPVKSPSRDSRLSSRLGVDHRPAVQVDLASLSTAQT